jgi:hypothetical protein
MMEMIERQQIALDLNDTKSCFWSLLVEDSGMLGTGSSGSQEHQSLKSVAGRSAAKGQGGCITGSAEPVIR